MHAGSPVLAARGRRAFRTRRPVRDPSRRRHRGAWALDEHEDREHAEAAEGNHLLFRALAAAALATRFCCALLAERFLTGRGL